MDALDVTLIQTLEDQGRVSFKELGKMAGVSDVTIKNRIEKLQNDGIIRRFTIDVDYEKIGMPLRVTMGLSVEPSMIDHVLEQLKKIDEFFLIWKTSGAHSINVRGAFRDHRHLNEVLNRSMKAEGIREYHLSILDTVVKDRRVVGLKYLVS